MSKHSHERYEIASSKEDRSKVRRWNQRRSKPRAPGASLVRSQNETHFPGTGSRNPRNPNVRNILAVSLLLSRFCADRGGSISPNPNRTRDLHPRYIKKKSAAAGRGFTAASWPGRTKPRRGLSETSPPAPRRPRDDRRRASAISWAARQAFHPQRPHGP